MIFGAKLGRGPYGCQKFGFLERPAHYSKAQENAPERAQKGRWKSKLRHCQKVKDLEVLVSHTDPSNQWLPVGSIDTWQNCEDRKLWYRRWSSRRNHARTWPSHALRRGLRHGSDDSQRRQIQPSPHPRLHDQRLLRPRHRLLLQLAIFCSRLLRIFNSRCDPPSLVLHSHSRSSSLPLLLLALLCSTSQGASRFRLRGESISLEAFVLSLIGFLRTVFCWWYWYGEIF